MACACGFQILRILMFVINLIITVAGMIISAGSIYVIIATNELASTKEMENIALENPFAILLAAGIFLSLLGILGCCGACLQNQCMLVTYSSFLVILVILEVVGIVLGWNLFEKSKENLRTSLKELVKHYPTDMNVKKAMDHLQQKLECCGSDGSKDYGREIPESCYQDKDTSKKMHEDGCFQAFEKFYKRVADIFGGCILVLVVVVEGAALIIAMCLYFSVRREQNPQNLA